MKIISIIALLACSGASVATLKSRRRSVLTGLLKRKVRSMDTKLYGKTQHEPGFHSALEHLMQTTIMQDVSTYFDVVLSGAASLAEVNAVLAKRNPHFIELNQQQLDFLIDQWLFQLLAK